ncbi:ABC-2 type transport system ATP-binding protein [Sporomusaceae bacterium BoRhaA]|uniref:ABC transporter ATP-binding protein n=1 Tax=Pelorhabdus rhamnosifermentans TaxID=2772457 RepID=UPI001C05FE67|nr:ABC transporter ATP-binding protein [Pelorhabdus rhamnosifermentans]MBU2702763.1 ABC-2 type transport system ATP-binding protein [Pelorhabdus rhamnosifermentans]
MIKIENIVKTYGTRTAINQVNLSIKAGEMFGLLGPNGAGKTTMIRVLTMLTSFDSGTITVHGLSLPTEGQSIKELLGVVPQHLNLDADLTAWENLELHGRLHHMPARERHERMEKLLDYVELKDRKDDMVQTFSGGMKRRLMIARALLHRPKILFLDEPTVGLDPQVRRRLWGLILRLNYQGLTVLLTTHYIEEAEALCQRVAIMEQGKLITTAAPADLCQKVGQFAVEWTASDGMKVQFFDDRSSAAAYITQLNTNATLRKTNLEDVFVELTGRKVSGS